MQIINYKRKHTSTIGEYYEHLQETTSRMMELTEAPKAYNSVHGLKTSNELPSEFKGDEYAIYSTSQQRIR